MKKSLIAATCAVAFLLPAAVLAADGHVVRPVEMMAGPGDYPTVDRVAPGDRVDVHGCVEDYAWCDVSWHGVSGWIHGDAIQYDYRGRRVLLPQAGINIGVPIINFDIGSYWGEHYRDRPFFHDRDRWDHHDHHDRHDDHHDHD